MTLDARQTELVNKFRGYFSDLNTLQGNFVQTSADNKRMKGKFYVKRPGRFRFDYARPSRQIVVSDGHYLAIQDLDLNNEDRVALDETPFRLLLRSDVDLVRDARIMEVQESEDLLVVGLVDKNPDTPGQIKLFLSTKPSARAQGVGDQGRPGPRYPGAGLGPDQGAELDGELFTIKPSEGPWGRPERRPLWLFGLLAIAGWGKPRLGLVTFL